MTFKEHLRQYAERELELIGFMQSEFGPAVEGIINKNSEQNVSIC